MYFDPLLEQEYVSVWTTAFLKQNCIVVQQFGAKIAPVGKSYETLYIARTLQGD